MAEHSKRGEHLRQLIGRARGIHVPRPHRTRERQPVGHQAKVVRDRIAVVDRHCVAAVSAADPHQPIGSPIQCVFPRHLVPTSALTDHRSANAIGIFMKIEQRRSLGADVAAAERIVRIAADRSQLSVFSIDQDAARGLAERTDRGSRNTSFYRPHESHEWPQSHRATKALDADGLQSRPGLWHETRQMNDVSLLIYRSSDGFRARAAACAALRRALSGPCFLGASVTPWQKWLQQIARLRDISWASCLRGGQKPRRHSEVKPE